MDHPITTVDEYVAAQPEARREILQEVRACIRRAAPDATESIRYDMPAYRLANGHPVYFAGWKHHLSVHDVPQLDDGLESELRGYRSGKDTLKFPYRDPIPFDLVTRTVEAIARRPG